MSLSTRRSRSLFVLFPVLALFALLALLVPSIAAAETGTADSGNTASSSGPALLSAEASALVTGSGSDAYAEALAKFWTPQRMSTAIPADQVSTAVSLASAAAAPAATGAPERIEPAAPVAADTTAPELQSFVPDLPSSHIIARTYGKVFFTDASDGLQYVCSGTVVNSTRKDTVWTAGHCVHGGQGGTFHQDWYFVPAYKEGQAPYGVWTADNLVTRTAWAQNSDLAEDLGVAIMTPVNGVKIVDAVGGQGIAWNFPPNFPAASLGYPAEPPTFDGERLVACVDHAFPADAQFIVLPCDMTGGSSGGGWLRDIKHGLGYLNGVNSFGFPSLPGYMFSPYYGDAVKSLYYYVVNEA